MTLWRRDPWQAAAVVHRDGIPWDLAPLPPKRHRCEAQSRGSVTHPLSADPVERCACGAWRQASEQTWWHPNLRRDLVETNA